MTSEAGQGTTFRIYFPAVAGEKAGKAAARGFKTAARHGAHSPGGGRTHRPPARQQHAATLWLHRLATESGVEALKVWEKHKDRIDLLLTDIVMPDGMTGYELARQLQADKPAAQSHLYQWLQRRTGTGIPMVEGVNFLQKPYAPQELAEICGNAWTSINYR